MFKIRKILYPTDFSSYSTQAYLHALMFAESTGATLTVAYVFTPGHEGQTQADRAFWQTQLERVCPTNAQIRVSHVFLEGDPAREIVQYATDAKMDMIVIGSHGRTVATEALMGHTTEQVLRQAPCSVLVVNLPKGQPAGVAAPIDYAHQ
ncbi:MAG: universal stress protein [Gemmataceae bacterium]